MIQSHLLTIIISLGIGGLLTYKASFLKNKKLFRLTLFQILYLIVLPSVIIVLINSYIDSISKISLVNNPIISDSVLKNIIVLALMYTGAGQAIHMVSKSLFHKGLRHAHKSEAAQFNTFLHLTFSHNLIYCGAFMIVVGLVLLELNHVPSYEYNGLVSPIIRGLLFGTFLVGSMYRYIRPDENDGYAGRRWSDLGAAFLLAWIGIVIIGYILQRFDPQLTDYQLLLPSIVSLGLVSIVNVLLTFRFVKKKADASKVL